MKEVFKNAKGEICTVTDESIVMKTRQGEIEIPARSVSQIDAYGRRRPGPGKTEEFYYVIEIEDWAEGTARKHCFEVPMADRTRALKLMEYYKERRSKGEFYQHKYPNVRYILSGARGRQLIVFKDKCIFVVNVTLGSLITQNATDGEKTVYYSDVIGVQFKESGLAIGYLQLETAGGTMNNKHSNFFNENTFTFEGTATGADGQVYDNAGMRRIADEIRGYVEECKKAKNTPQVVTVAQSTEPAKDPIEEIKRYKELLDMGILTEEEFTAKKKLILGI